MFNEQNGHPGSLKSPQPPRQLHPHHRPLGKYNFSPRLVTPIPHVKSSICRPSSYTTYEPSPFVIMPSVIRPNPFVTCLTPKAYKFSAVMVSVVIPLEGEWMVSGVEL